MPGGDAASAGWFLPITPTFVLPYKRYAAPSLLDLAQDFLEKDRQSYRQTVQPGGMIIGYGAKSETDASLDIPVARSSGHDDRILDHMTVWRMLSWLGSQIPALTVGLRLLLQHDPNCTCHRFIGAVAPHKFRSPQRDQNLRHARRLLHLIEEWNHRFPEPFFPRFATRPGFS